jgi:hypothetical protein
MEHTLRFGHIPVAAQLSFSKSDTGFCTSVNAYFLPTSQADGSV